MTCRPAKIWRCCTPAPLAGVCTTCAPTRAPAMRWCWTPRPRQPSARPPPGAPPAPPQGEHPPLVRLSGASKQSCQEKKGACLHPLRLFNFSICVPAHSTLLSSFIQQNRNVSFHWLEVIDEFHEVFGEVFGIQSIQGGLPFSRGSVLLKATLIIPNDEPTSSKYAIPRDIPISLSLQATCSHKDPPTNDLCRSSSREVPRRVGLSMPDSSGMISSGSFLSRPSMSIPEDQRLSEDSTAMQLPPPLLAPVRKVHPSAEGLNITPEMLSSPSPARKVRPGGRHSYNRFSGWTGQHEYGPHV